MSVPELEHHTVETNGVRLHAVAAGPADGPLLVLLHGFPEFWYGWRAQIPALAAAGFRVVAPDQRGYNLSDKPESIGAYVVDELAGDVAGLIGVFGRDRAFVAGHDWGANVAWRLAMMHPERVERLAILNVPHPRAFLRALRTRPEQWRRSWYIAFFQLPRLPEALLRRDDFRPLCTSMVRSGPSGTFRTEDLERYREAWAQPGALRAMIDWYRAPRRQRGGSFPATRITPPTLVLWGERDAFLVPELAPWSVEWCDDGRLLVVENASHWVQHETPERVSDALIAFFRGREVGDRIA